MVVGGNVSDFLSNETRGAEEKVRRLGNRDEEWDFSV